MLYDLHALLELPNNMVSNAVEGHFQTVVYDMRIQSPWTFHMTMVQVSYAVFCLSFLVVQRSVWSITFSLTGAGWFLWQAYDKWTAGNQREAGKWEWIALVGFFVLAYLISVAHELARHHIGGRPTGER